MRRGGKGPWDMGHWREPELPNKALQHQLLPWNEGLRGWGRRRGTHGVGWCYLLLGRFEDVLVQTVAQL